MNLNQCAELAGIVTQKVISIRALLDVGVHSAYRYVGHPKVTVSATADAHARQLLMIELILVEVDYV